jgi:hypothetical protein
VNVSSPITFGRSARAPDVSPGSGDLVIVEGDPSGSSSTRRGSASRSQVLQEVCRRLFLCHSTAPSVIHPCFFFFFMDCQVQVGDLPERPRGEVTVVHRTKSYAAMSSSRVRSPVDQGRGRKKVATMSTKPRPPRPDAVSAPVATRPVDVEISRGHHVPRISPLTHSGPFSPSGGLKRPPAGVDLGGGTKRVRLLDTGTIAMPVSAGTSSQGLVVIPFDQRGSPHTPPGTPPPSAGSSRRRRSASRSPDRRRSRSRSRGRRRHSRRDRSSSRSRSGRSGRSRAGSPEREVRRRSSSRDRSYTPRDVRDEVSISAFRSPPGVVLRSNDYHFYLQETRRLHEERSRAIQRGGGQKKTSERSRRRK